MTLLATTGAVVRRALFTLSMLGLVGVTGARAQTTCSNGTNGVKVTFSSITVLPDGVGGGDVTACLSLAGDGTSDLSILLLDFTYNNAALTYTPGDFTVPPNPPNPFDENPYDTQVNPQGMGNCPGAALNTLCVDIEDIGPNALQVPYPGPEGLEYVCINFTITDQSQSTEFDIDFFMNNGDLDACPDSDWSTFAGGSADLPLNVLLPVELVSFDARTDGEDVLLAWETATETNNAGFEVQHTSAEATEPVLVPAPSWQPLVFVEGHGTSLDAHTYSHRVSGLEAGLHRFRLKQVDFDGAFAYSPEVEIEVGLPEGYRLSDVYPNPFNPQAAFTLAVAEEQAVRLEVFDVLGRSRLVLFDGTLAPGKTHRFSLNAENLSSGSYLVRATGETFADVRNVTLQK